MTPPNSPRSPKSARLRRTALLLTLITSAGLAVVGAYRIYRLSEGRFVSKPGGLPPAPESRLPPDTAQHASLDQGSLSASGIFTPAVPRYVNPDYKAAEVNTADVLKKTRETDGREKLDTVHMGLVSVDRRTGTLSFPARLNMQRGLLEYALVHSTGKAHEALLVTEASPLHVHLGALLLRWATPEGGGATEVAIEVEWQPNGPAQRVPLEELIARAQGVPLDPAAARKQGDAESASKEEPGEVLERGAWIYSGSTLRQGALMAAVDGSIIALVQDPSALVINPRPGNTNDRLHVPSKRLPPTQNFPVVVHMRLAAQR